jgi:hypothetical protein
MTEVEAPFDARRCEIMSLSHSKACWDASRTPLTRETQSSRAATSFTRIFIPDREQEILSKSVPLKYSTQNKKNPGEFL